MNTSDLMTKRPIEVRPPGVAYRRRVTRRYSGTLADAAFVAGMLTGAAAIDSRVGSVLAVLWIIR